MTHRECLGREFCQWCWRVASMNSSASWMMKRYSQPSQEGPLCWEFYCSRLASEQAHEQVCELIKQSKYCCLICYYPDHYLNHHPVIPYPDPQVFYIYSLWLLIMLVGFLLVFHTAGIRIWSRTVCNSHDFSEFWLLPLKYYTSLSEAQQGLCWLDRLHPVDTGVVICCVLPVTPTWSDYLLHSFQEEELTRNF